MSGWIANDGEQPEPEVAEDVGHDIKNDRRRSPLGANDGREGHDAVGFAAHQPAGCGVVEGESRYRDFIKPPEFHFRAFSGVDDYIP